MMTKLKFLWVLLALLVGGVNGTWADNTYELILNWSYQEIVNGTAGTATTDVSAFNSSSYFFDATQGSGGGFNDRFTGTYNSTSYTRGLKMNNGTSISFTTTNDTKSVISIVQCTTDKDNSSTKTIKFDGNELAISSATIPSGSTNCREYTISNVSGGDHTITYGSGESGLFYVKVVMSDPTYTINIADLYYESGYGGGTVLNREVAGFNISASSGVTSYTYTASGVTTYSLKVPNNESIIIGPNSSNSSAKITKVVLHFFDGTLLNVSNSTTGTVTLTNTSGNTVDVTSLDIITDQSITPSAKITPTLTFSPNSDRYLVGAAEQNLGNLTSGTLRTNPSALRMNYTITNNGTGTSVIYHISGVNLGIIPGNTKGREIVTATLPQNAYFNTASATFNVSITDGSYEGEYTSTTSTDLYVANGNAIPTAFPGGIVEDGKYLIDGKERNLIGAYAFTEEGAISDGEEISDVPGITATFAKGSNYSEVKTVSTSGRFTGIVLTSSDNKDVNATITFTPSVNGYLSLQGNFYETQLKQGETAIWTSAVSGYLSIMTEISTPLIAGQTYVLGGGNWAWELHGFSFRPAFLDVSVDGEGVGTLSSTETSKSTPFAANLSLNKSHFPHLIAMGAAGGSAKFSGDRAVVNLYTNNDVDLLADNTAAANPTIIKGTVLHSNNVDELFTYYFLRSSILTLESVNRQARTGTSEGGDPIYGSSFSISNQDYVAKADLENGRLLFHFSSAISRGDGKIQFKAIGSTNADEGKGDWIDITSGWTSISGNDLIVNIGALDQGRTYQIQIASGAVEHSTTPSLMNSEINFMFTVIKSGEAQVKMIYPTGIASVATSIVLQVSTSTGATNSDASDSYTVQGMLNGFEDPITAFYDGRNVVFKPSGTLQPNTTYTLTLDPQTYPSTQTIHLKNGETVTTRKEFYFTTGAAIGDVPLVTSTMPVNGAKVSVGTGTIRFTFNQDIELQPYCRLEVIPINGSEAYIDRMTRADGGEGWTIYTDGDKRTIYVEYTDDGLKYDMYHEVRLPANTVTGVGGKANEETIIRIKANPAPGYASDVYNFRSKEDYPYTWDMSAMKTEDIATVKNTWTLENGGYNRPNMLNCYGKELSSTLDGTYNSNDNQSYQGTGNYTKMDDFRGLRLTTAHNRSARRVRISAIDNPSSRCLSFVGNTHYMCIPNVPQSADASNGEHLLYIEASVGSGSNDVFALNCPTEMAEWVGDAPQRGDSRRVYKIRVKANAAFDGFDAYDSSLGRDIPLVCSNANIYKIAYSTYNKTLTSGGEGYATDAHDYHNSEISDKGVDYAMTATLDGKTVTPYYVSAISDGSSTTAGTVTLTQITDGVPYSSGVVLIGTAGTTFPVFATSYSKPKVDLSDNKNKLIGVTSTVTLEQAASNVSTYYYILNNRYEEVVGGSGSNSEDLTGRTGSHIGFYLMRGGESLTMNPHAAYFTTNTKQFVQGGEIGGVSAARSVYFFRFEDENGNDITGIAPAHEEGVADRISQGDGNYYDLRGQRITRPSVPGIYVRNGKKIYVK